MRFEWRERKVMKNGIAPRSKREKKRTREQTINKLRQQTDKRKYHIVQTGTCIIKRCYSLPTNKEKKKKTLRHLNIHDDNKQTEGTKKKLLTCCCWPEKVSLLMCWFDLFFPGRFSNVTHLLFYFIILVWCFFLFGSCGNLADDGDARRDTRQRNIL